MARAVPVPRRCGNSAITAAPISKPATRNDTAPSTVRSAIDAIAVVSQFHRCGDLAVGFTRLQCPDCVHERLLAFTCRTRHFCPSCHQRKVRQTGDWIARVVCIEVPHRQFVFTMPKPLRGIFRERRKLLDHLFTTAIESLRDSMRARLELPEGQFAAVAAVQTFGDYTSPHEVFGMFGML